jgi:hypothetical protein
MTPTEIRTTVRSLQAQGRSLREISRLLALSRNTVRRILREPLGKVAAAPPCDDATLSRLKAAFTRARGNVVRVRELLADDGLALEIQRGGIHEHNREIGEQRAPTGEQPLLDKILDAARDKGSAVLIGRGQFLAEPGHGAVEVMELQAIDTGDAVVATPLIAGAVRAGDHQPVQDGEEDGSLDGKLEAATSKQFHHPLAAPCVAPQTFEQQWRPDAPAGERWRAALIDEGQDHRTLGEACGGSRQAVKVTATFNVFLAPKIADDALPGPAILTDGLYQVDVGVAADTLFADEHGASIRSEGIRQAKSRDHRSNLAPRYSTRIIPAPKAESKSMP